MILLIEIFLYNNKKNIKAFQSVSGSQNNVKFKRFLNLKMVHIFLQ